MRPETQCILYEDGQGHAQVDVMTDGETMWLSQKGMSELFNVGVPAITKHDLSRQSGIANILESQELREEATVPKMETVRQHSIVREFRTGGSNIVLA